MYITNLDALPESILTSLLSAPGIEVLPSGDEPPDEPKRDGGFDYWGHLVHEIETSRPDVVIFGRRNRRLALQLAVIADTRLLMLNRRGSSVDCCQFSPDHRTHSELGADDLIALIRSSGSGEGRETSKGS